MMRLKEIIQSNYTSRQKIVVLYLLAKLIDIHAGLRRVKSISETAKVLAIHFIVLVVAVSLRFLQGVDVQLDNLIRIETIALVSALVYLVFSPPRIT